MVEAKTLSIADLKQGVTYHFRCGDGTYLHYVVGKFQMRDHERGENWVEIIDRSTGKTRQLLARYIRYINGDIKPFRDDE